MRIARYLLAHAICLTFAIAGALPAAAHTGSKYHRADIDTDVQSDTDNTRAFAPSEAKDPEPIITTTEFLLVAGTPDYAAYIDPGRSIC